MHSRGRPRLAPAANNATPHAVTPANIASADTPSQIAPGNNATNGTAARARSSRPSTATVTGTATVTAAPASTHTTPAAPPPDSPIRSSQTNTSVAPGGWPDTCVGHESGWKSRMRAENVDRNRGMSVILSTTPRYSPPAASRFAIPRCQPSTIASAKIHATEVR
jgi:hypothetical protein